MRLYPLSIDAQIYKGYGEISSTAGPDPLKDYSVEIWNEIILYQGKVIRYAGGCVKDRNLASLYAIAKVHLSPANGYTIRPVHVHTNGSQLFPLDPSVKDQKCLSREEVCAVITLYREKYGPPLSVIEREFLHPTAH